MYTKNKIHSCPIAPDINSQLTFTCSKSTIETLEKVNNNDTRKRSITSFWHLYC